MSKNLAMELEGAALGLGEPRSGNYDVSLIRFFDKEDLDVLG